MYQYRIQIEEISDANDSPLPLSFEAFNHDDLITLVKTVQQGGVVEEHEAASVLIGFKLLTEVVLKHRKDPPFAALVKPLSDFIKALKSGQEPRSTPSSERTSSS